MTPGTIFTYNGETGDGEETIVVEVTNDIKQILRVTCIEVKDTVSVAGEMVEDTYDWYAQDDDGNVWYFGEDTKEYDEEGNVISTEGSWEAGVDGTKPGIIMWAKPNTKTMIRL